MKKTMYKIIICVLTVLVLFAFIMQLYGKKEMAESAAENTKTEKESSETTEEKKVIGVAFASAQASYQQKLGELLEREAQGNKEYTLEIAYAGWNIAKQEEQLEDFVKEKVDAIILCPVNPKSFLNVLKEAKSAGIPVINLNMKVDTVSSEYITTYVGGSMSEQADLVGQMVVDCLNGEGKIGIIEGIQGSDPQIYRTQTFLDYIASYPKIEVVGIMEGNWSRTKAALATMDLIKKDKNIDLIYCHDSNMAMGVYDVLKDKGLEDQIRVIGIGSEQIYIDAVKKGKLYGIVTQSPEFEASFAWSCAKRAAEGYALRSWYKNPANILTKDYFTDTEEKKNSLKSS